MDWNETVDKFINSEKGQKFVDDFIKLAEANDKIRNEMKSSTSYVEWLIDFTKDKESFGDTDWLYQPEKISDSDKLNVEKLYLFYDVIYEFAMEKHIEPTLCEFGNYYKVIINGQGYEIGILIGQGTVYFCHKVDVDKKDDFINYDDILNNKSKRLTRT